MDNKETCNICGRLGAPNQMEDHHLFPGNKRKTSPTILVCQDCGDQIHNMFDNQRLVKELNTASSLIAEMTSYIKYIRKQPMSKRLNAKKKKRKR